MSECPSCKKYQAKLDAAQAKLVETLVELDAAQAKLLEALVENDVPRNDLHEAHPQQPVLSLLESKLGSKLFNYLILRWSWVLGGVLVAGLVVWVGFLDINAYRSHNVDAARKTGAGVPVKVALASFEKLPEIIGAGGLVEPVSIIEVKMPLSGRIKAVNVDVGSKVTEGQALAELDSTLFLRAVKTTEDLLRLAKANLAYNQSDWERIYKIYIKKFISKVDLDRVKNKLDTAQFDVIKLKEELTIAQYNLENTTILAPADGIIMNRYINHGENVQMGNNGFTLGKIRPVMVVAQVPEEKVGKVYIGQEADITFSSFPNLILSGTVESINPQTNPQTRTFKTYIKVQDPEAKLTPGLSAYARLKSPRRVLTIPRLALIKNAGVASAFVVENSEAHLRVIQTGSEISNKVEVLSGLQEGQQVVYYGLLKLKDGDKVNLQVLGSTKASTSTMVPVDDTSAPKLTASDDEMQAQRQTNNIPSQDPLVEAIKPTKLAYSADTAPPSNLPPVADVGVNQKVDEGTIDTLSTGEAADLVVDKLVYKGMRQGSIKLGKKVEVIAKVLNSGGLSAGNSKLKWVLSTDSVVDNNDLQLGKLQNVSELTSGDNRLLKGVFIIPATVVPGTYYLGAVVDSTKVVAESKETNNAATVKVILMSKKS